MQVISREGARMSASEVRVKINAVERSVAVRGDDEALRSVAAALRELAKSIEELEKIIRMDRALK